jgi:hypothetical protein
VKREVLSIPPIYILVSLHDALLLSGHGCLSVASATIVAQLISYQIVSVFMIAEPFDDHPAQLRFA